MKTPHDPTPLFARRPVAHPQHNTRRMVLSGILATLVAGTLPLGAFAQTAAYPTKPIRVIVPFPPGGGGDTLARLVMSRAGKELGQPIVFENISGAGGNIGAQAAARAPADGYTLLYGTNGTHGINMSLYKSPGYDAAKDFEPISQLTRIAAMLVVRPGFSAQSVEQLITQARQNPGKFTFASAGNGTTSHLAGELLKSGANIEMVHVPYRGGAQALTDLLAGQVDMLLDVMPNTAPQVRAGKLQGLAVSTTKRAAAMPDIPTIAESGLPGFNVSAWDGIFAPVGTPPAVIQRVNAAVQQALASPELQKQLVERGAEAASSTPQELGTFVKSEIARWGQAVKQSKATAD